VRRTALLLAAVGVLAACDRKAAAPPPAATTQLVPRGYTIPKTTKQLVTAIVDDWTSTHARVALWSRTPERPGSEAGPLGSVTRGGWQRTDEWPAVIGKNGSAWGIGVHPSDRTGPTKREGDLKSPAGVFAFRSAYGYAEEPHKGWRLPYEQSADLECIDDPASEHYTKIVDRKQVPSDWESAEQMRRDDTLYEWVIDVAHNPDAKPGAGSCIFLHVWSGPESSTAGCTAMDKGKLEALLDKLDPASHPLFVLMPRAEYSQVASAWGLPAQ
jgi:L,D-peptidoglycan transpeptidase YkuD (ErfK/YbiS/YcfS/YnhG family)